MGIYITLAGNIGSGKSSLVKLAGKELGWKTFVEYIEDHPYISQYYMEKKKPFHNQMFFLAKQLIQHVEISGILENVCQDRSVWEGYEVFVKSLFELGMLDRDEFKIYSDIVGSVSKLLRPPDLLVYLQVSAPILQQRIGRRRRPYESSITLEYLEYLRTKYEQWVSSIKDFPVLIIDVENLNWESNDHDKDTVLSMILGKLSSLGFHQ